MNNNSLLSRCLSNLSNNEEKVYEIIASLPIDYNRVDLLRDITYEAQLLIKSKFTKKITLNYSDFQKLHEYSSGKNVLLITEISGKRFVVYIEKGVVVSTAMIDPSKGDRIVGLKPLATLITISKQQPVVFKLFEIQDRIEDKTLETPLKPTRLSENEIVVSTPRVATREEAVTKQVGDKPLIVVFAERLKDFKQRAEKILYETLAVYGCRLVDYKISIAKETIKISIVLRRKSVLSKCRLEEAKSVLKTDLELILTMLDINLPLEISIVEEK